MSIETWELNEDDTKREIQMHQKKRTFESVLTK